MDVAGELLVILLLIIANGFFAGSELAVISARKGRMAKLAEDGVSGAIAVTELQKDPHRFLATVQIGVTLVGTMASAVGGATAVEYLKPVLADSTLGVISEHAEEISLLVTVLSVSYLSLILGELAPKTIGMQHADKMSILVARPIRFLSVIASPVVRFLTVSNHLVLRALGIKGDTDAGFMARDEVLHFLTEGQEKGAISEAEHQLMANTLEFTHTTVREVMVPRPRISAVSADASLEQVLETAKNNLYSRYPVYQDAHENLLGILHVKDLVGIQADARWTDCLHAPAYVPEDKKASELLREMQRKRYHMAVVVDEYGGISGIVTSEDLLEELVGEIEDEYDDECGGMVHSLPDGSHLVDATTQIRTLEDRLDIGIKRDGAYDTLAGFVLAKLGRFPKKGESLDFEGYRLTCEEVSRKSIISVKIEKLDTKPT